MNEARAHVGRALRPLMWPLAAIALLLLFNALMTPGFFTLEWRDGRLVGALVDVVNHGARIGIVALGMTLVIATGGVDLSVGAIAAIAGAAMATLAARHHAPWPLAIAGGLGAGLACGVWNGVLVGVLRLQPIVATLVLMVAGRGIAQLITGGLIVTFEDPALVTVGNGLFLGLPVPIWLMLAAAIVIGSGVRRTPLGLFTESVGDNEAASRLAGVPDRAVRIAAYAACGVLAAAGGVIEASYIKAADANNAGNLLELDAILAVVIGGTALRGGRFSLVGTLLGAMFMQMLSTTLYMRNVPAEVAPAPKAMAVIVVCLLQSPRFRGWVAGSGGLGGLSGRKGAA